MRKIFFKFCVLLRKSELYWVNPKFIQFLCTLWFQVKRSHERIHILQLIFEMVVDRQVPSHMWKGQATKYHNIIKRRLLCRWYWCLAFSCCIIRARDLWDWSYKLVELQAVPERLSYEINKHTGINEASLIRKISILFVYEKK